jgi:AcrR family transcriptional regulator
MEQAPRRNKRKAATRAALLDAGRRLIEERGAEATQVGDIARASGVAHGTFYVHFASKDALLDELWLELDAALGAKLRSVAQMTNGHLDERQLSAIAGTCVDYWREHRGLLQALAERAAARADLRVGRDGFSPTLIALFSDIARGARRNVDDARLLAEGLVGMWMRIGMLYALGGDGHAPTREQAMQLLAYSLSCVSQPMLSKAS